MDDKSQTVNLDLETTCIQTVDLDSIKYINDPFPYCVIDNFIENKDLIQYISNEVNNMKLNNANCKFTNEKERNKFAFDKISNLPVKINDLLTHLTSKEFVKKLEKLTGISGLIVNDKSLKGAGIHIITTGGRLGLHTDFNSFIHPKYGKLDRRINLLLYLNENWQDDYKGDLLLCDASTKKVAKRISPVINRCVIFNTTNKSIHGHPEDLNVPPNIRRKSIAVYYYTINKNSKLDFEGDAPHSTLWHEYKNFEDLTK